MIIRKIKIHTRSHRRVNLIAQKCYVLSKEDLLTIHSYIPSRISIAPFQVHYYSEVLPTPAPSKRTVLTSFNNKSLTNPTVYFTKFFFVCSVEDILIENFCLLVLALLEVGRRLCKQQRQTQPKQSESVKEIYRAKRKPSIAGFPAVEKPHTARQNHATRENLHKEYMYY